MYGLNARQQSEWSRRDGFEVPIVRSRSHSDRRHNRSAWPTVRVTIGSDVDIVVARQHGMALATAMDFSATDSAFIATTVSELARALLSRTRRGEIWLHAVHEDQRSGVVIVARDPAVRDEWRNSRRAAAANLTFPDVFRLVDEFDIASDAGGGTTIRATKWCRTRSRATGG